MPPEVKPWMRRAAEQGWRLSVEQIAQAIAAHAPPVEEMVFALHAIADGIEVAPGLTLNPRRTARKALALYDSWLAKQGEANG